MKKIEREPILETSEHTAESRALKSGGISDEAIYQMVRSALSSARPSRGGRLLDVGCGTGALREYVRDLAGEYIGADILRYAGFPDDCKFFPVNLDLKRVELDDACMDVVVAVETIEHVENPRALVRELARLAKPGGVVLVTTPNNLSLLSKLTLVTKNQFNAFQDSCYPAHITALVEQDLRRIVAEAGLIEPHVLYSNHGRIPGTSRHWPARLFNGRRFSDNVSISAMKPH